MPPWLIEPWSRAVFERFKAVTVFGFAQVSFGDYHTPTGCHQRLIYYRLVLPEAVAFLNGVSQTG